MRLKFIALTLVSLVYAAQPVRARSDSYNYCPDWSPDGRQIAYVAKAGESEIIYVMNADGSNVHPVTPLAMKAGCPDWSRDGERMLFISEQSGNAEIYVINADGQDLRNLTQHPAMDAAPAWSPDGKRIAFVSVRDGNGEVYVMDTDGANVRNVTKHPANDGALKWRYTGNDWFVNAPAWSPDGKQIAFISDRDSGNIEIYAINIDGSNPRNLTRSESADINPAWSPNGKYIAFTTSGRGLYSDWEVYVMQADGRALYRSRSRTTSIGPGSPVWSPDSKWIAYSVTTGMMTGITVRDVYGGTIEGVSSLEMRNFVGDWSPDGKQILFVLNNSMGDNIYVMNADGSNPVQLTGK